MSRDVLAAMDSGDPARALDSWLDEVTQPVPVALCVDDPVGGPEHARRADVSGGGPGWPVALVATVRSEAQPDGHPLHRWLADVLRLDRVEQLQLQTLDRMGEWYLHGSDTPGSAPL